MDNKIRKKCISSSTQYIYFIEMASQDSCGANFRAKKVLLNCHHPDVDVDGEDKGVAEVATEGDEQPNEERATPAAEALPHCGAPSPSPPSSETEQMQQRIGFDVKCS